MTCKYKSGMLVVSQSGRGQEKPFLQIRKADLEAAFSFAQFYKVKICT